MQRNFIYKHRDLVQDFQRELPANALANIYDT